MNFEQVEAFMYVALTGSFSKAAEILFLSQPSVSARVKALENEIGIPLFYRVGKSIALTQTGKTLLPYAQDVLKTVQEAKSAINRNIDKTEGELTISSVFIVANYVLPTLIEEFTLRHPKVKLIIHTGHSHHVLEQVVKHEVQFGISRSVSHNHIETTHLFSDEMVLAVYPEHHFSQSSQASMEDVAKEPLILFNRGSLDWMLIHSVFQNLQLHPNVIMELDNIELVKQMVKNRIGIAFLPRFSIQEEIQTNKVKIVPIQNSPQIHRNFEIIYLKGTRFDSVAQLFINFLVERTKERTS